MRVPVCALFAVLSLSLPISSQASEKVNWEKVALADKYPRAPEKLDSTPDSTGLVVMEGRLKGFKVCGAVLEGEHGELVRASDFAKNLVLFHDLEPGKYSLRVLRFTYFGAMGQNTAIVIPEGVIAVDVQRGTARYLGVVKGHAPTIFNAKAELEPNREHEISAWKQFARKYSGSGWARLAEERVAALNGNPDNRADSTGQHASHP